MCVSAERRKGERMSRIPTQNEKEIFADLLIYAADCIRYYNRVSMLPDCNNCFYAYNGCKYKPGWGEDVRINCPHWKSEEGEHE